VFVLIWGIVEGGIGNMRSSNLILFLLGCISSSSDVVVDIRLPVDWYCRLNDESGYSSGGLSNGEKAGAEGVEGVGG
jgi:hypothetical protein